MIRDILTELVKQTTSAIEIVKVTGTDRSTKIQGVDENKLLFMEANLKNPLAEFKGEFGISNFGLLKGLLNSTLYKNENSKIIIKRREMKSEETVEQIEFRDSQNIGCDFRCMSADRVPDQAEIANIPWDIEFEPSTTRLTEFSQLGQLFGGGEIKEKLFGLSINDNKLIASFGDTHAATHRGNMVLDDNIVGKIKTEPLWSLSDFNSVLKLTFSQPFKIRISNRGVLGVEIQNTIGTFQYYLRAQTR